MFVVYMAKFRYKKDSWKSKLNLKLKYNTDQRQ